jgi:hypothetical protein
MMPVKAALIAMAALGGALLMTPVPTKAITLGAPISVEKSDGGNIVEVRHRKKYRKHRHWRRHAWRHRHYHHRRHWARRYWCDPYYEYCGRGYYRRGYYGPGFGIFLNF